MMLWDIIRDWFVMNVWGGFTSQSEYYTGGCVGNMANKTEGLTTLGFTGEVYVPVKLFGDMEFQEYQYIGLGDWLSTTSTIIVLIAVCVALFFLVRYFFRMFAGLLSGR